MIYLFNVKEWLEEIVDTCAKRSLDPAASVFCLILFSSLDTAYVRFFRNHKEQISSYSGENVHLFSPVIFDNDVIPDHEWQSLRQKFIESGINLGNGPSAVMFRLQKRSRDTGFDPEYLGAFSLPERRALPSVMRDFVAICINHRTNSTALLNHLSEMLGKPNLIQDGNRIRGIRLTPFDSPLHAPIVFLSYSHADIEAVQRAYEELKKLGLRVWLDRYEIPLGASIFEEVTRGLDSSDAALLFLSSSSANSSWLPFEGAYLHGRDAERVIIPVILDSEGKSLAGKLPFTAGRLYVDMSDDSNRDAAFALLADRVKKALTQA